MERTKLLTIAVVGLLILNLFTIGFLVLKSERQPLSISHEHPPMGGPFRLIVERLHFDEEQQRQYRKMADRHHEQTVQLNDESVLLFQTYYKLLAAFQSDSSKTNTLVRQIADVQRRIAELNFAHFQEIKALCRPDQQADYNKLVDDLARLFGKPQRGRGPSNGGPPESRPDGPPENFPPHP
ncbi:periplasmic heavy metal sensor [Spirosoma sp. BT702]|uniref:Periplasmic heavy metal sensor n=1 Tax=Spirosoma profusum TaxID=2771354 RepID=A0A927ARK8_9BACT|nr:periplasmic heavy metal sensor [Spirosoma profusum]MBD2702493.1 periplasmic heavy metal sensor [Spirosoma profusum]